MPQKGTKTPSKWSMMPFPMKIIDRHVPGILAFHLKVLLFAIAIQSLLIIIDKQVVFSERTLNEFILMVSMIEAFLWLSYKIFIKGIHLGETREEISKNVIVRYFYYYVACLVAALIIFILFLYGLFWAHGWDLNNVLHQFFYVEFKGWFKLINFGLLFGTFLFVIGIWQDALKQAQKLKEEKLIFRYETLKNQVNPHFLFNSLNTLSSLVSTNAELAEQFIQKLSSIYRYVLEYREIELVDLTAEIAFVKDYFYLQQIRDEDKISLEIEITEPEHYKILPMSLQLLVENALKHNLATREKPLNIFISQSNDMIVVKNNLQKKLTMEPSPKIGLKNLGERVKFMTKQELQVIETADEFNVIVPIILK